MTRRKERSLRPPRKYRPGRRFTILPLRSERFVITARVGEDRVKLFQIGFMRSDGGLYVTFPYFTPTQGILSRPSIAPGGTSMNLEDGGKVTGNRVKFTHHPTGETHFSQTDVISSEIRKQSIPLASQDGHVFTVHVRGFAAFQAAHSRKDALAADARRSVIEINFSEGEPKGVRFIAHWYSPQSLKKRILVTNPERGGPQVLVDRPDGTWGPAYLLASPNGWAFDGYVLLLIPVLEPGLDEGSDPYLIFFGGFDVNMDRDSEETHLLALSYPVENYKTLKERLGSVDLRVDRI